MKTSFQELGNHLHGKVSEDPAVRREENLEQAFLTESIGPPVGVSLEAGAAGVAPGFDPPLIERHPREKETEKRIRRVS